MISLKRLEAMKRWQRDGGSHLLNHDMAHAPWALAAGLLRVDYGWGRKHALVPTEALAPAIAKAEAEHARHRTEHMREVHRRRAFDKKMDSAPTEITLPIHPMLRGHE